MPSQVKHLNHTSAAMGGSVAPAVTDELLTKQSKDQQLRPAPVPQWHDSNYGPLSSSSPAGIHSPSVPWTSCINGPGQLPPPGRGATSALMSSEGDAAGSEATCSHLQEALLSPNVPAVSPFACDLSPIIRSSPLIWGGGVHRKRRPDLAPTEKAPS